MKISDIFEARMSQEQIMSYLQQQLKYVNGDDEEGIVGDFEDGHELVEFVNNLRPPNLEAQQFIFDHLYTGFYLYLRNVQQPLLNKILTDEDVLSECDQEDYDDFVRAHFAHNQLLMNKWIRYGEAMRNKE